MERRREGIGQIFNMERAQRALGALEVCGLDFAANGGEIIEDLLKFEELLRKWQNVQNLVSRETLEQIWERHIADSLQLLRFIPKENSKIVDFGSGGGFPAIILAMAQKNSNNQYELIEANSRKCAFLRTIVREFELKAKIINKRIEDYAQNIEKPAKIIIARALAPLNKLLHYSKPVSNHKTRLIFPKGAKYAEELKKAHSEWEFNVVIHKSLTNNNSVILEITDFAAKNQ